jgi:HAD superfamily hydrolase (TIGR01490 family)
MKKEVVIFDIDNTILSGYSQRHFVDFLFKNKKASFIYYFIISFWFFLYKIRITDDPRRAMEYGFSFIKNKSTNQIRELFNMFFKTVLIHKIYADALSLIKNHQSQGREIILISNAPDLIVKEIADYLNVREFICTKLEQINGVYTGKIDGVIMYGKEKLKAITLLLESESTSVDNAWFYSDHESDMYLLSKVKYPIVVNPTQKLKKIANKMHWKVLNFNL